MSVSEMPPHVIQGASVPLVIWLWDDIPPSELEGLGVFWGRFKNAYELINLRALKISMLYKIASFNVWVRYLVWNFKGILWNSAENILPIHWKMCILLAGENLRALSFKELVSKGFWNDSRDRKDLWHEQAKVTLWASHSSV